MVSHSRPLSDKALWLSLLARCPDCAAALDWKNRRCGKCSRPFFVESDRLSFSAGLGVTQGDWLDRLKERVRSVAPWVYPFLVQAVSPVYTGFSPKRFVRGLPETAVVVNLGAGTTSLSPRVLNVDLRPYRSVNLVADAAALPLRDGSIDAVVCNAVLEHVPHPLEVVAEIHRVLKPGGLLYCFVPFMQGVHGSPHDYTRWTADGLRRIFADWEILSLQAGGPTSALVWIAQEWLAMVLSLGIRPLYRIFLPLTWILSPLKFVDLLLNHHPERATICSGYLVLSRKRSA